MKKENLFFAWSENFRSMRVGAILLFAPAMFFVSCNDSDEPVIVSVSMADASANPNEKTIEMADTTFKFGIVADQVADGNVEATIEADLSLVSSFNTANQTDYLPMVEGSFVFSKTVLTIPDGQLKSDSVSFTVKPSGNLKRQTSYLLPVKIKSVSGNGVISETSAVDYFVITVKKSTEVILEDIDRSKWTIECSSEETKGEGDGQGKAIYLLDNNIYTFWHSQYLPSAPAYPHWMIVNMNEETSVRAFWIVNCQESWASSKPEKMYFEVSSDKTNWKYISEVTATSTLDKQIFQLDDDVTGTYFRVTFETSLSGEPYCYLGELGASFNKAE